MNKELLKQPEYRIQPTLAEHVGAIRRFVGKLWLDIYPNEGAGVSWEWVQQRVKDSHRPESIQKAQQFIENNAGNPTMISRVALDKAGKVIGTAHGFRSDTGEQYVGSLYVATEHQGTGVAHDLMADIVDWSDPTQPLLVKVATYNERARAFYRKWGFIESDRQIEPFDGIIPQIEMIRQGDAMIEHAANQTSLIDRGLVIGRLQEYGVAIEQEDLEGEDDNEVLGIITTYVTMYDLDMDDILPQITPIESRERYGDTQ